MCKDESPDLQIALPSCSSMHYPSDLQNPNVNRLIIHPLEGPCDLPQWPPAIIDIEDSNIADVRGWW
jgi:hypothetical protein